MRMLKRPGARYTHGVFAAAAPSLLLAQTDLLTGLLGLSGVLLITLGLLMMLRKRKQQRAQQPTAREQLERLKQKHAMRGDLEHLMVELEQLTRRFNAQLDAKSLQLEKLIDQADRRIDELKRLQGEPPSSHKPTAPAYTDADIPLSTYDRPGLRATTATTTTATTSATNSAPSPPAGAGPSASTGSTASNAAADAHDPDRLMHEVYALADRGHDPTAIARQLNEHIGKVELMLALRKT